MTILNIMRSFVLSLASVMLFAGIAMAQTSEDTQATETVDVIETPLTAETEAPVITSDVDAPKIDLSDPALIEALEAREKADRAIADAVRAQQEAEQTPEVSTTSEGETNETPLIDPDNLKALGQEWLDKIVGWLTSPTFLAQLGAIILAYFLAPLLAKTIRKRVFLFRDPPGEGIKVKIVRDYIYRARNLLRPIFLVGLLALFAIILKAIPMAGQDWLVKLVQGLAVVFLLFSAIKEFISNPLFSKIAVWVFVPLALLAVFGYYDDFIAALNGTTIMQMGDTPITIMTLVRLAIFGGLFFWLGNLSNTKGQDAIRSQEGLDIGVREIVAKLFQILLFIILIVLVLSFAGIPLSGLVVIFSAVGLGIGFGLQPIAANFISGLIILFDRSVKVGDFVVLPDGQEGFVEAINMRSTTVETTDGKDIMVPNTVWTENAYENWTHKDPRQRYEVYFTVSFDTDIDKLEDILIPAISEHPSVLQEPEEPDLELREFGDNGIKFAIEFWCSGIDDGPNKFTSDLNFIVWRTLKKHKIKMPLPQRVVQTLK